MKVLVDGVSFENNSQIGIWRLFYEVMSRTSQEVDYTLLLSSEPLQPIPEGVRVIPWITRYDPASRIRHYRKWIDWPKTSLLERRFKDAIWHSTFFSADPRRQSLSVVTIYDMIAEVGYAIGPYLAQRNLKSAAVKSADVILAISETTAQQFVRFNPASASKVHTIPLGHEHLNKTTSGKLVVLPDTKPYCLFIGGRYAYKNFCTLVEALSRPEWPSHLNLVVVGAPFDDAEKAWIDAVGVASKLNHVGKISDDQLAAYYRKAECFVFPSLMEGFGIPILEAQAAGTVPLLSDTPVFREVGGSGAVYFDPHSPGEIANCVRSIADAKSRLSILENAANNLQRYSWDETAKVTMACYASLRARI